ncbi:MAG: YqgE/AlgH family protein [Fibrobacterota bacterium]
MMADQNQPETFFDPEYHLSNLKEGSVLIARESLLDPNFQASVVLVCMLEKNKSAVGLVCNRPTHMPLSEVFNLGELSGPVSRSIYIGGPVQQDAIQILQITRTPVKNAYRVEENVYLGGEWNSLEEVIETDERSTRLFLGYSGWGPGQLESEVEQGAWEVYNPDLMKLFTASEEPMIGEVQQIRKYIKSLCRE